MPKKKNAAEQQCTQRGHTVAYYAAWSIEQIRIEETPYPPGSPALRALRIAVNAASAALLAECARIEQLCCEHERFTENARHCTRHRCEYCAVA